MLEIQERPPSPLGRIILWVLCLFIVLTIGWMIIGKTDIVAIGQGKIIPNGYVKTIQPLETGVVTAIHVENGQQVKAGDVLLELDITQTEADVTQLKKRLPIAREKLKMIEKLHKDGAAAKFELLTQQEEVIALEQELAKAEKRNELQRLIAPIDGTIQELQTHTIGGVVTLAQALMKVVPFNAVLEAEIMLGNKDIGFVEVGQEVAVKLEAFPFTKYGMLDGTVINVSHDAIQNEDNGLVFMARIAIQQTHMRVGNKEIPLSPGMALTAEIKTGQRRIIEYFLSPILKYQAEIIRER
ncbi:MAG: HlyD family efflux transporter periplasmic adaptor subunit [Alphaproteobacteria bacterium]|nr:HlyD family efflux transporter periplasmic adaptor subunit [Alphaproteobacteria bacterium]MDD9919560.1 HlyD family efflux transporter periplasmic adaptor subunit [Alphaproteobacteria bacterium]